MPNNRRRLQGRVISDKMDKTVVVAIEISKMHRVYKKVVRSTKKIYAHDESNTVQVGDIVRLVESKPMSKLKRWVVEEVVEDVGNKVVGPISDHIAEEALNTDVDEPEAPKAKEATDAEASAEEEAAS